MTFLCGLLGLVGYEELSPIAMCIRWLLNMLEIEWLDVKENMPSY